MIWRRGLGNWLIDLGTSLGGMHGHREDSEDPESGTGTVRAGAPGECAGGTEPPAVGPRPVEPVAQEILAWRGWVWDRERPMLRSIHYDTLWEGPVLTADKIPAEQTGHGIYALITEDGSPPPRFPPRPFAPYVLTFPINYRHSAHVWGQVALSGIVLQGEYGYRAERAMIRSLIIREVIHGETGPSPWTHLPNLVLADELERRYQCPVTWECFVPTNRPVLV